MTAKLVTLLQKTLGIVCGRIKYISVLFMIYDTLKYYYFTAGSEFDDYCVLPNCRKRGYSGAYGIILIIITQCESSTHPNSLLFT